MKIITDSFAEQDGQNYSPDYHWGSEDHILIGPIPHIVRKRILFGKEITTFVPDYSHPGVKERVEVEVDEIEALCWVKGRD